MATTNTTKPVPNFNTIWENSHIRSILFSHLSTTDLCSLRLTSTHHTPALTTTLFTHLHLPFTPSSLTRPSRLSSLTRIGAHTTHLTFSLPHSPSTFLPPLIHPITGREVNFLYTPYTSSYATTARPKYGTSELGDLLMSQYTPIFHAATNVPSFIRMIGALPNLRHLTISCPGQEEAHRYRRSAVDYALISLRIAVERNDLPKLEKLSLPNIHPSSLLYLRSMPGFGSTPSAGKTWKRIRKLNISMQSWDFWGSTQQGKDHLKILDDYIRSFSSSLEKVSFTWVGGKGPCPFTLFSDPLFAPPRQRSKLFGEVTSPMSPLPEKPRRGGMRFPKLRYLTVRNAIMSTEQVAGLVLAHKDTVKVFDFDKVFLTNDGEWEDALEPLRRVSGSDEWMSQLSGSESESSLYSKAAMKEMDEVIDTQTRRCGDGEEEEDALPHMLVKKKTRHRRRRRKHRHKSPHTQQEEEERMEPCKLVISAPIPLDRPISQILQPTVFDPNIQGVQRNMQLEASQQELADDPEKRVSTLKKAKEAVLKQLGKEFRRKQGKTEQVRSFFSNSCSATSGMLGGHESRSTLVPLMFSRY